MIRFLPPWNFILVDGGQTDNKYIHNMLGNHSCYEKIKEIGNARVESLFYIAEEVHMYETMKYIFEY